MTARRRMHVVGGRGGIRDEGWNIKQRINRETVDDKKQADDKKRR